MAELLGWIKANPVTTVVLLGVAALVGRTFWRWLTRRYEPILVADAVRRLNDGQTCFLDVRTASEVRHGTIPGAMHIPTPRVRRHLDELRQRAGQGPIVVYCHSGMRSASVAHLLTRQGFAEVYNLQGGMMAWQSQGQPTTQGHE